MLAHARVLRSSYVTPFRPVFRRGYAQDYKIKRMMRLPKQKMYDVVGNVSEYSEFVPYCLGSTIVQKKENGTPEKAVLRVGWNQLDENFMSDLVYTDEQVCAMAADNSMFKELSCKWTVTEVAAKQCQVELVLRFEFQNKLYDFMAQSAGPLVAKKMIEAFTQRAVSKNRK